MRNLVILGVVAVIGLMTFVGCTGPDDAHGDYVKYMARRSLQVDQRDIVDDFHNAWLMDDRPTHLSPWINE